MCRLLPIFILSGYLNTCFTVEAISIKRATTGYPSPLKPGIHQMQKDLRLPQMSGRGGGEGEEGLVIVLVIIWKCKEQSHIVTKWSPCMQSLTSIYKQSYVFVTNFEVKIYMYCFLILIAAIFSAESTSPFICWHIWSKLYFCNYVFVVWKFSWDLDKWDSLSHSSILSMINFIQSNNIQI